MWRFTPLWLWNHLKPYTFGLFFCREIALQHIDAFMVFSCSFVSQWFWASVFWMLCCSVKMKASVLHHKYVLSREIKTVISLSRHTHSSEGVSAGFSSSLCYLCKCRLVKSINTGVSSSVDTHSDSVLCIAYTHFSRCWVTLMVLGTSNFPHFLTIIC